jgi:small subunit ribosomal protein S6
MAFYEHVFIARQDISPQQVEALTADVAKVIESNGGKVTKTENWGLRNLAYKIRKNRKGHYVLLNIEAPTSLVAELERTHRINEDVLRYLTVRVDELEDGPSAMMQSRSDRGDRGPRRERGESWSGGEEQGDRSNE